MGAWTDAAKGTRALSEGLAGDEKFRELAINVGPQVIGSTTSIASGHPLAGTAAKEAANVWAKKNPRSFTNVMAFVGATAVFIVLPIVAPPILLAGAAYKGFKKLIE